jgi:hypothetical protein
MLSESQTELTIHTKTYKSHQSFVSVNLESEEDVEEQHCKCPISSDLIHHLNQKPVPISDTTELKYKDGYFSF